MNARLHVVEGEDQPVSAGPPGSADLEDAWYHHRSHIDAPSTEGIWRTDMGGEGGGVIHVHFATDMAFVRWARHLGFDITQEPKGRAVTQRAIGSVPFRGRNYAVHLHHTRFADEGTVA